MIDQAWKLRALTRGKDLPNAARRASQETPKADAAVVHVVAVTSGKGGVGKTTLAVNLAVLLADSGKRVLIVDADLGLANVDVMLRLDSSRHIGHLLLAQCTPDEIAAVGPSGVQVISGGSGLQELAEASNADRQLLLDKLRGYYQRFDYVFIDTSPGIGADVVDFLRDADELVLVTTPEPTSLRDTYAALKTIGREAPNADVRLVVNMASAAQAEEAMAVLNEVASKFLNRRYDDWQCVECDPMVGRTVREGKPLVSAYPRSAAAICLRRLARSLGHNRPSLRGPNSTLEAAHAAAQRR